MFKKKEPKPIEEPKTERINTPVNTTNLEKPELKPTVQDVIAQNTELWYKETVLNLLADIRDKTTFLKELEEINKKLEEIKNLANQ